VLHADVARDGVRLQRFGREARAVAARVSWTTTGSHEAEWQGIRATGRQVSLSAVDVFKLAGGMIVQERIYGDFLGILRQLGAIARFRPRLHDAR
jgi:predicted ester cyclase